MSRDALIVGINQYQTLPQLSAAAKDAEGVASILETYSDFRVRRLPEAIIHQRPQVGQQTAVSTEQLERSLVNLLLPKGDHIPEAVFFYFSGHGLQREIGIREGYLATSDTRVNVSNSGLSLMWLRRLIKHSPVRQIIIVLDCCHSGEFLSLKDDPWQGSDGQSYLFIAASREYEAAYESLQGDYSVLTQALLSGLSPQNSDKGRVTSTDLAATVTNQLANELQQPLFEQGGSEIVITYQAEYSFPKGDNLSLISRLKQYSFNFCPYRGLQPFEEKHTDYYFGREALIQELLESIEQKNICALIGASGSGKTSLLRAGIIPRLSTGKEIPGSEHWLVRYVQIDDHPVRALAGAFAIADQEIEIASQLAQAEDLLRNKPHGLANLVTAALLRQPTADKFWLIIDQFESLLARTNDPEIQQERQQLITALLTTLSCQSNVFGIILSLRSNAIDDLTPYGDLFSLVENNQIVIPPMTYQNIRDVIEKPAAKLGLRLDPYLIHNLTLDLTGAPGELSLLQMTLHELWQHRIPQSHKGGGPCLSLDSYMKLGRIPKLVVNRAEEFYATIPQEEQLTVQRIFLALCDLGEGRLDHSRQAHKLELINSQYPEYMIDRALQKLVAARLVVINKPLTNPAHPCPNSSAEIQHIPELADTRQRFGTPLTLSAPIESDVTIELTHTSLISDWPLLRQWLCSHRSLLRQRRDIETRAWTWHQHGESNCSDYLLRPVYLNSIQQLLPISWPELSTLAQRFIKTSQRAMSYQQLRSRGIAILLPVAMIAGMTVSLIRHQLTIPWKIQTILPTNTSKTQEQIAPIFTFNTEIAVKTLLPQKWGTAGADRLAIASQILEFHRRNPQAELSDLSISQLVTLMTPSAIVTSSVSLPDTPNSPVKFEGHE